MLPFILPAITALAGLGQVAGKASQNAAAGRAAEADLNLQRDKLATDQWATAQDNAMRAAQNASQENQWRALLGLQAPNQRATQVMRGDLMSNVQDVNISGLPPQVPRITISGGLRPSALGPNSRAAGSALSRQALEALLSGSDVPAATNFSSLLTAAPGQTALPKQSGWAKAGNILGIVGSLAGSFLNPMQQIQQYIDNPAAKGIALDDTVFKNVRF